MRWRQQRIIMSEQSMSQLYREYRKEKIKENCIVFESLWGRSYSCNPAAFYEYICENHPEYECVWFLNDIETPIPGNAKKVLKKSEEYYHYLATAKYFVYNANFPYSFKKRDGQVVIQTMHGTPFKTFGLDVKEEMATDYEKMRVVKRAAVWDYLVAQGEFTKKMAWTWFRYNNNVLETGYPRTDVLYKTDEGNAEALRKEYGIPAGKKVILYAPTWRDMDRFDMMLDIEEMRRGLSDEYVLLVRPHYFVAEFYEIPEDGKFVFDACRTAKIEDLFPLTDILITDYSSVMFDFTLTKKPMIFFAYDLKEYTENTRGSYFDISTEAPGALTQTTEEVVNAIRNIDSYYELNGSRIESFCSKYLTYENDRSSELIYDTVFVRRAQARGVRIKNGALKVIRRVVPGRVYSSVRDRVIKATLRNK